VPLGELAKHVLVVDEAPLLEEGALDPADQILHRALLLRTSRPAQLNAEPQVEHHGAERRVPLGDGSFLGPLERNRLRSIEDSEQRKTTPCCEVLDHRAHERFDLFVLDERYLHPARVLQTRGEEVHALLSPVEETNVNVSEVVLRKLAGESFETNHRSRTLGAELLDERVQRALGSVVALQLCAAKQLDREHIGLHRQLCDEEAPERFCLRRSTDSSTCSLCICVERRD
jgi:hypothetical protein